MTAPKTPGTASPPRGGAFALGRPGGELFAPKTPGTASSPRGGAFALGRPGGKPLAPKTLIFRSAQHGW
jgi:hypothetical protein